MTLPSGLSRTERKQILLVRAAVERMECRQAVLDTRLALQESFLHPSSWFGKVIGQRVPMLRALRWLRIAQQIKEHPYLSSAISFGISTLGLGRLGRWTWKSLKWGGGAALLGWMAKMWIKK
jgi:hypothetical protein